MPATMSDQFLAMHASDLSIITSSRIATTQATHDSDAAAEAGHAGWFVSTCVRLPEAKPGLREPS